MQRKIIFLILYLLIYLGIISKYIIVSSFLPFFIDLLVIISFLASLSKRKKAVKELKSFGKGFWIFYLLLFVSSIWGEILNMNNMASYLWGLRAFIRYAMLLWIICLYFDIHDVVKYKQILYKGFYVNILFCFIQFFQGMRGDAMTGTFTANGPLMLFCLIVFLIAVGDYYYKSISRLKLYVIVACLMLVAIWAEIKMMYFLFPLLFYSLYILLRKFSLKLIILSIVAYLALIPTMKFCMSLYYDETYVENVFDPEFINEETSGSYGFQEGGFNRSTAIEKTDEFLLDTPVKKVVGHGLGSASVSQLFSVGLTDKYMYTLFWNFSTSYCLFEMGWLGFVLYFMLFFCLLVNFFRVYYKTTNQHVKYWASMGVVSVLATYMMAWYDDNVYYKYLPMYFFWGICIVAINYYRIKR